MGQRSQIYVRYNGHLMMANYYQWNYGERMISRARYGIEYLIENFLEPGYSPLHYANKISRIFDVNFDMKDVQISSNIFKEYKEFFTEDCTFNDYCFEWQDNNDGRLLIDITADESTKIYEVKYAFLDNELNVDRRMTAEAYLFWNHIGYYHTNEFDEQHKEESAVYTDWQKSYYDTNREMLKQGIIGYKEFEKRNKEVDEIIDYTQDNADYLSAVASLMDKEEVIEYLTKDYSRQEELK